MTCESWCFLSSSGHHHIFFAVIMSEKHHTDDKWHKQLRQWVLVVLCCAGCVSIRYSGLQLVRGIIKPFLFDECVRVCGVVGFSSSAKCERFTAFDGAFCDNSMSYWFAQHNLLCHIVCRSIGVLASVYDLYCVPWKHRNQAHQNTRRGVWWQHDLLFFGVCFHMSWS